jgi:general secretion pathway protein G
MNRTRKVSGFTLVEILIVVVILGILAAIVIPQFTSASETAKASSLVSQLQTIRSQLELYQVQHNGTYPTVAQLWDNMTTATDITGGTPGSGVTSYGPYLQQSPINPFEDSSVVIASTDSAAAQKGWSYNATTGAIKAIVSADKATELNLDTTNDVVTYASGS